MTQQLGQDRSTPSTAPRSAVDRFFQISDRGSTITRELRGGLTTFVAMAYIVMLNPQILGSSGGSDQGRQRWVSWTARSRW